MIEQEQVVQEKKDDVVSEEAKKEEEKPSEENTISFVERFFYGGPKKREYAIYNAIFFFVLGLLSSFAPAYLETNVTWIVNVSGMTILVCWSGSIYFLHDAYRNLLTFENTAMITFPPMAIISHIVSEMKIPKGFNPAKYTHDMFVLRVASYGFLVIAVMIFMVRLPDFITFYAQNKSKIRAFFTAKHTIGFILSILAVGTALFQFIQVVLQIFHL